MAINLKKLFQAVVKGLGGTWKESAGIVTVTFHDGICWDFTTPMPRRTD